MRFLAVALVLGARTAAANPQLTPVTNRDYSIDLYEGFALGSSALVAMGGAGVANAIGSSGTLINVSAPAVRQTTDTDSWSWDYHLDYLDGSLSTDYDNAQIPMPDGSSARVITVGLQGRYHDWAMAVVTTGNTEHLANSGTTITAQALHNKIALAHWIPELDLAVGGSLSIGSFELLDPTKTLFSINGAALEAGAQWLPSMQSFRLGASIASSASGLNNNVTNCDPMNCDGYILPNEVFVPGRVAAGAAYRWADSPWNQLVKTPFRDEHAVTVVADLVATGASPNAYGLQAFGVQQLERSGRHISWSMRGGAEYEWLPGRLRVRGGTYWEPGRFEGVDGRLHITFGIEVRVFEFELWGPRRGRITLTGDGAPHYQNVALSIGFWH